jgi:hypothetical protein
MSASQPVASSVPARPVLVGLLLLATLPPFVAQASGSVVGSYTMFNRIERYHVELGVVLPEGERRVLLHSLAEHLTHESRPILLPADGQALGADQVDVVAESLPDLARLCCELYPSARTARARLLRGPVDATRTREQTSELTCPPRR